MVNNTFIFFIVASVITKIYILACHILIFFSSKHKTKNVTVDVNGSVKNACLNVDEQYFSFSLGIKME